ncbi:MAG: LptA/OstA family protein [bacterium]
MALVVSATPATAAHPTALEIKADVLRADTVRGIVEARGRVRISDGRSLVHAGVAVYTIKQRKISLSGGVTMTTPEGDLQARAAVAYVSRGRTLESIEATGNVEVESQRRVLNADNVVFTPATQAMTARGNVRVFVPPDLIATGQQLVARRNTASVLTGRARVQNRDGFVQGDRLEVDDRTEAAFLRGNVVGEFQDVRITSDAAALNSKEKKVVFRDRVKIVQPGRTMTADRVTIFYETRRMIAEGATTIRIEDERP